MVNIKRVEAKWSGVHKYVLPFIKYWIFWCYQFLTRGLCISIDYEWCCSNCTCLIRYWIQFCLPHRLLTNGTIRLPFASHWKSDVLRLGDLHVCVFTNYDPFLTLAAPLNVLMEADDSGVPANLNFPEWFCNTMTF